MWSRGQSLVYSALRDPRSEFERDASMRGTEIVATVAYGHECIDTERIVAIITDL